MQAMLLYLGAEGFVGVDVGMACVRRVQIHEELISYKQ